MRVWLLYLILFLIKNTLGQSRIDSLRVFSRQSEVSGLRKINILTDRHILGSVERAALGFGGCQRIAFDRDGICVEYKYEFKYIKQEQKFKIDTSSDTVKWAIVNKCVLRLDRSGQVTDYVIYQFEKKYYYVSLLQRADFTQKIQRVINFNEQVRHADKEKLRKIMRQFIGGFGLSRFYQRSIFNGAQQQYLRKPGRS